MSKKLENAPKLKTRLIAYYFNISDTQQVAEYQELVSMLKADGRHWHHVFANPRPDNRSRIETGDVELDCSFLFGKQWNTTEESPTNPRMRVFDWYEGIFPNLDVKQGHYLEITDEMREILDNTHKCGYCGAHEPAQKGHVFCHDCLGSEYLGEEDLYLLRMLPVSSTEKRKPLTKAERAHLLPLYVEAQTVGADTRAGQKKAEQRQDAIEKAEKAIRNAEAERDGFVWLLDRGVNIDNCIYYSHTSKFSFGWRQPVSDAVKDKLLDIISEFPFPYDIKTTSGVLEGY